jgi:hypothetical protein
MITTMCLMRWISPDLTDGDGVPLNAGDSLAIGVPVGEGEPLGVDVPLAAGEPVRAGVSPGALAR